MDLQLKRHPLSEAFPDMTPEQFAHFKRDIERNGQQRPVIIHEGMVLDGWHRVKACAELGREFNSEPFEGSDPASYVLSVNLHRRKQLTHSQRAYAVVACKEWHKRGQTKSEATSDLNTSAEMAQAACTSVRTITDVRKVIGTPFAERVRRGDMSASKAASAMRARQQDARSGGAEEASQTQPKRVDRIGRSPQELEALRQRNIELEARLAEVSAERDQLASELERLRRGSQRQVGEEDPDGAA